MKVIFILRILCALVMVATMPVIQAAEKGLPPQLTPKERVLFYTQEWEGERDKYGRPWVSDEILERMKHVGVEEAWSALRDAGYLNQMETEWKMIDQNHVMVGRALTTAFLPRRPELDDRMIAAGSEKGLSGGTNQWPIDLLVGGDVVVADHYGKQREAAFYGDNLAQAIYTNSGTGAIVYGQIRDMAGVRNISGFKAWAKHIHPSSSQQRMLISINDIIRIGEAVVLPGDVVLATEAGVIFIPPQLAEKVIVSSEVIRVVDGFRIEAMKQGRFTSQQVYVTVWTDAISAEFYQWLETNRSRIQSQYSVGSQVIDRMIQTKDRSWEKWFDGNRLIPQP